ncbi:hypothetical protein [Acinetobacter sp. ESBL14]|uniref:hypothetical protein n=1 Tax=Acinetobacter sp. ESBL14 TaxID=3077329 RepID=UPI002FCBE2E1
MQNDSTVQTEQAEIPTHLQCEPRTYEVIYDRLNHCSHIAVYFASICEVLNV